MPDQEYKDATLDKANSGLDREHVQWAREVVGQKRSLQVRGDADGEKDAGQEAATD